MKTRALLLLVGAALSCGAVLATAGPAVAAEPLSSVQQPPRPTHPVSGFTLPTAGTSWRIGTTVRIAWNTGIGLPGGPIELVSGPPNARESAGVLATSNLSAPGSVTIIVPPDVRPGDTYALRSGKYTSPVFTILKAAR